MKQILVYLQSYFKQEQTKKITWNLQEWKKGMNLKSVSG